jgi:hypothetical protein
MLWSTGIQWPTNKNRKTASSTVSGTANLHSRISKIYLYLQPVWGDRKSRLVIRDSTRTRSRNQTASFFGGLNNYGHLSYEKQQELLGELGKIEIGVGTLVATNERIDGAVNPTIDRLKDWLKQTQPNIHVDETPWLVKRIKEWLWIFGNTDAALFHAADTRYRAELESILGSSYSGVLSSDDDSAYRTHLTSFTVMK